MDDTAKRDRLAAYARLCRERGLRNTVQKRAILEGLLELDTHPTADEVHERVTREYPEISRTTVYRALEGFSRLGLIGKACHLGNATRYDTNIGLHHHLVCLHCDSIVDISDPALDALILPDTSDLDFEVRDFRVQLRGICRRCRNHRKEG